MERPKQSSLDSPDESKAISADDDFGTQVKEASSHDPKPVSKKVEGENDAEMDGEEGPTDDRYSDDDSVEEDPVYEYEDYEQMEPREKREEKRKDPKSDKQRGKERRKCEKSRKNDNRKNKYEYPNIS